MRILGKSALYKGNEYEFGQIRSGQYIIISNNAKDVELGFKKVNNIDERYTRIVSLKELDLVYDKKTIVIYKGDEFIGSIIKDDKIMLYTRDVPLGKKHNMIMRDKDEYFLYVDLKDIVILEQKWIPLKEYNKKPTT